MAKQQEQLTLSGNDQTKLNGIIEKMKANKESDLNIRLVTQDFTQKYGVKKKDLSSSGAGNTSQVSGKPSATSQSIDPYELVNTSSDLIPTVETTVPTPLSPVGQQEYLNNQIPSSVNTTFDAVLGSNSANNPLAPSNPELANAQGIGGKQILDSKPEEQQGNFGSYTWNQLLSGIGNLTAGTLDQGAHVLPEAINFTPSGVMAQIGEKVFGIENPYKRDDKAIDNFRNNDADNVRNYLVDRIGADIDPTTQQRYNEGIITGGIGGLANSIPAMAGAALTGNITPFFIQGYDSALQSLDGKDVDNETKTLYATGLGYVNARLEKIGFDKIFPNATNLARGVFNKSLREATEETAGKVTGNVLDKYIDENLKGITKRFAKFGSKGLQGFVTEYGTGSAQEVATIGSEYLLNEATGKPVFDTEDMSEWEGFVNNVSRVNRAGLMEGVGGGIMGGAAGVLSPGRKKTVSDTQRLLDIVNNQLNDENLSESAKEILLQRKLKLEDSIAQEVQADQTETENLSPEQRTQAELLSGKVNEIEQVLNDPEVDEEVKATIQQEFDDTVNELNEIVSNPEGVEITEQQIGANDMNVAAIQPNDIVNYTDEQGNVQQVPVESIDGDTANIGINNNGVYETRQVPVSELSATTQVQTEPEQGIADTSVEAPSQQTESNKQTEIVPSVADEGTGDNIGSTTKTPKNLLQGIINRLKKTGLAKSVKITNTEGVKKDLAKRRKVRYQKEDFRDYHSAPQKGGYEDVNEALDDTADTNLSEIAKGQHNVPDDYFKQGSRYPGHNTKAGRESKSVISAIIEKLKKATDPRKVTVKMFRAVPNNVSVNSLIKYDWVTPSKEYAKGHGDSRFGEGEYKIIEQDVPAHHIWWDGNDINEWGYDPDNENRYQRDADHVKGYVDSEGNIVINEDVAGIDTPIHEFGHIWEQKVEQDNPELHAKGMELIKGEDGKPYVEYVKKTQPKLKGDAIYKEALAQAIGDNGARLIEGKKANSVKQWLNDVWDYIAGLTGISGMTPEQISNLNLQQFSEAVAVDLLSGKEIFGEKKGESLGSKGERQSRTEKALSNEPRSFIEAINQFFLGKGALSTEDFIRLTGFGYVTNKDGKQVMSPELKRAKFLGFVKDKAKGGMAADMILMNHVPEAFQRDGGMDLISEIADIAVNSTKGRMLAEIEAMETDAYANISEEQIAEWAAAEKEMEAEQKRQVSEDDLALLDKENEKDFYEQYEKDLEDVNLTDEELSAINEVITPYIQEDGSIDWEKFENDFVDLQNQGFNDLLSLDPETLNKIFTYGATRPKGQIDSQIESRKTGQDKKGSESESSTAKNGADITQEQSEKPAGNIRNTASEQARSTIDKELSDLNKQIDQQRKKIQNKLDDLSNRNNLFASEGIEDGATQQQLFNEATNTEQSNIDSVIQPLQAELDNLIAQRDALEASKEETIKEASNQQEIFNNQSPDQDAQITASYIMPVKPVTDLIKKGIGAVNRFQEKFIAQNFRKAEDYIANNLNNWLESKNGAKRISAQLLTSVMNGLPRTQANLTAKLSLTGGMNKAAYDARKMMENLYAIVDNDQTKLERVHQALDPDFYTEQGLSAIDYNSLGRDEQMLYDEVRSALDKVHQRNFALGFISRDTYDKFKGKYMPRLYEINEIPDDVQKLLDEQSRYNPVNKLELGQYKARKEVEDLSQKAIDNLLKDPVYAAAKRTMQMQQNAAINGYINDIIRDTPHLVKDPNKTAIPKGYQLMSGKGYGRFDGKYVPNYIAEDLKGFRMLNKTLQEAYDAFKAYDRLGFRQFLKKSYTVFNPVVQMGNFISNFTFAFSAGIDPITFAGNMPKAYKALTSENADYQTLLKAGILGSDIVTADLIPSKSSSGTTPKNKNLFVKAWETFDEKAMKLYGMSDEIAKMNAFITFKEQGFSEKEAIQKVYEGFQNYATVGKMWDVASKTPLIGNPFIKFQADLYRIMKNGATKTPLTTSMYLASLYFMPQILSAFGLGDKEEDEKEYDLRTSRNFIPKVPLGFMDIPLVYKTRFGEVNLARYLSPFYLFDTGNEGDFSNLIEKITPVDMVDKEQVGKGNKSKQIYLADPVLGTLTSALFTDTDFRGKSIQDPEASRYRASGATETEKLLNKLTFLGRSWIPQGAQMHDFYLSQKYGEDYYGRTRDLAQSMMNMVVKVQDWQDSDYKKEAQKRLDVNLSKIKNLTDEQKNIVKTNVKHREDAYLDFNDKKISPKQLERRLQKFDEQLDKRLQNNAESYDKVIKDIDDFVNKYREFLE